MMTCQNHASCVANAIDQADQICLRDGLRFTELRRTVLKLIWASHGPTKAYDLLGKLQILDNSAKPATVYRTLSFLIENGLIHKVNSLNAFVGCSHPLKHNDCYFLICEDCSEIRECCDRDISSMIVSTVKKNNFTLKTTTLEIAGRCNDCVQGTK